MTHRFHTAAMLLVAACAGFHGNPAHGESDKPARLEALYAQYWEENLELNPIGATFQGDPRYNDRLPNFYSEEYRQKTHDFNARWLETIEQVGPEGLEDQDLMSYQIF